jgi:hypothetical protein
MDEFSKTMIAAAVGGGLTILGGILAKVFDFWIAILKEKRDFVRSGKEQAREEIEQLKNQVGTIYELSINWKAYREKQVEYENFFAKDYEVIGRCNKYPGIAAAARDAVHLCKIVASRERDQFSTAASGDMDSNTADLVSSKEALVAQYQAFIQTCDKYIESLA